MENATSTTTQELNKSKDELKDAIPKMFESLNFNLLMTPFAIEFGAREMKQDDPEGYYTLKSRTRDILATLDKARETFAATFEKAFGEAPKQN